MILVDGSVLIDSAKKIRRPPKACVSQSSRDACLASASEVGTAVNVDYLTGDKPGALAGKPRDRLRNFRRRGSPDP